MTDRIGVTRRKFLKATLAGAATAMSTQLGVSNAAAADSGKKIRVGVIGCGSVSKHYFQNLLSSPFVELVSCCDKIHDRAKHAAAEYGIPHNYPHIDRMLAGVEFDLFVNLTDIQEHYRLNKQALQQGKHVWSEKPMAGNLRQGGELVDLARKKGVRILAAPTVVTSPQFAFMAKTIAGGVLGSLSSAYASYGHLGPDWSAFFYEKGGGSIPDLGVYNITTLTGLLGPAEQVTAMTSVVTPMRQIAGKQIRVEAEDNAMITLDHGDSGLSHIQCGFNYFTAHEHDSTRQGHHTITIIGKGGSMHLAGYDWAPHGVDLATAQEPTLKRHAADAGGYLWQYGASYMAECLVTGRKSLIAPDHVLHVVEVIAACNESQTTGRRVKIRSSFKWPIIS